MIRLYIIEDHPVIIDGIKERLRHHHEEMTITGHSGTIGKFTESAKAGDFDIIILDLWLPGQEPLENLQTIREHFPGKPVIIYTQESSPYWIRVMMEGGAKAYLLKTAGRYEFKETIESVYKGNTVTPVLVTSEITGHGHAELPGHAEFLRPSERSLVLELASGATLKKIAGGRGVTLSAIEKILKKIRKNFGVASNPELISVLKEKKII
jgi:DNA-binding NarL/FixJ family response regulator